MNNPPEPPRMSSLDRRIEVARLRAERERAAAHPQPTQGLTSTMSTESCDIAQPRNHQPVFAKGLTAAEQHALVQEALVQSWQAIQTTQNPVCQAMDVLCQAMQEDPDYARSWHDNIAMAFKDSWEQQAINKNSNLSTASRTLVHNLANDAAARFMQICFGADTDKHAAEVIATAKAWQDIRPIKPNPNPIAGVDPASPTDYQWGGVDRMSRVKIGVDFGAGAGDETVHTIIQHEAASHPWAEFLPGRQASQQAQLATGDNTLRGIGNGWINGAPRTK